MTPNQANVDFQQQLDTARQRWEDERPTQVRDARFDEATDLVTIDLNSGVSFSVPAHSIQGLEHATPEQLLILEVTPLGDGLRWDALDVDVDIVALQDGIFGTKSWMARLGERGGRVSTPEKAQAARANGQRGGRPVSLSTPFWQKLTQAGVPKQFVLERLIPSALRYSFLNARTTGQKDSLLLDISTHVERIYKWSLEQILGDQPLSLDMAAGGQARFKIPASASQARTPAFVVYAHYLTLLALQTTAHLPTSLLEQSADDIRRILSDRYGGITLESALRHLWASGVTVFPLQEGVAFHGACWRVNGRNAIVLKQSSSSEARWLFDVLHEWDHVSQSPELQEFEVIEASETSAERRTSPEEQRASFKAGNVVLGGRAEELTERCVNRAGGSIERLKAVVPQVAREQGVAVGLLANYIASRLSAQGHNWWGAAANLQDIGRPFEITRDLFFQHARLDVLNDIDRTLLERALITQGA